MPRRGLRRALVALAEGGTVYPKGTLFIDCQSMEMDQPVTQRSSALNGLGNNCTETDYRCTIGPPVSEMEFIHTFRWLRLYENR